MERRPSMVFVVKSVVTSANIPVSACPPPPFFLEVEILRNKVATFLKHNEMIRIDLSQKVSPDFCGGTNDATGT